MNMYYCQLPRGGVLTVCLSILLAMSTAFHGGCSPTDTPLNNNNLNNGSDRCPPGYVLVSGGTFTVGVDEEEVSGLIVAWSPGLGPVHKVTLTADFCIGKTEVTVAQYRQCVSLGMCTGDVPQMTEQNRDCNYSETDISRDDHPMNCLGWPQAREYCQAQGGDLPSEAQWTRAAQGDDRRHFPWGNEEPTCSRANWDVNGPPALDPNGFGCAETSNPPYTWPVGSGAQSASPYGAQDMAGNVGEFLLDCVGPFEPCDGDLGCVDPVNLDDCSSGPNRYVRGGNYYGLQGGLYAFYRSDWGYDFEPGIGMRCVVPTEK